ncbi:MAG TPA: hypothetical protein VGS04_02850 [Nitrososphaerales archaeon]|nr:hypothetical protein [Nitrososphaerales archaeon]
MTSTSPPLGSEPAPPGEPGPAAPPSPEQSKSFFARRRGLLLAAVAVIAVLLVGTTFEAGMFGSSAAPAVNSADTPLTGGQLYAAYTANESDAAASYTNKTVYIQDSLDFGVGLDQNTGQYFSSVDSGNVLLFWSSPSQVSQLSAGSMVLAKCSVGGEQTSQGTSYVVVLNHCALVGVQSKVSTSASISMAYD